ncbi:helix-turn-helix domain-containing protein [Liquorilactobacillus mali]|uniref:helix-turn-helix domain-containing protein n=1 Tax=Liquorilactobacillus mali TaxID=1618 RepID=UPI002350791C|nr:helix-turn-helix transcriptional regulator [Liquorilactobacillus mali]MDC7953581.1 helix-turn-helix transcriptional regulator [Liquorilactobacillus mali]
MKKLREIRQKMCMTQAMLADKVGLTRQAITAYENGNNFPGERELNKLADVLCVSVDELMGRKTNEN